MESSLHCYLAAAVEKRLLHVNVTQSHPDDAV
jgi:hypothetical protein